MKYKLTKKAQTELLGFVMVVAVISIAVLFIVGFLVKTSQNDVRDDVRDKQLAIYQNKALLETSTLCKGIQVRDLVINCAQDNDISCGGTTPCDYLKEVIPEILNLTIGEQGRNDSYVYIVCEQKRDKADCYNLRRPAEVRLQFNNGNCSKTKTTPGFLPLPLGFQRKIFSALYIC